MLMIGVTGYEFARRVVGLYRHLRAQNEANYNLLKRLLVGLADMLTRASFTNKQGIGA